jgi:hypothetical protein
MDIVSYGRSPVLSQLSIFQKLLSQAQFIMAPIHHPNDIIRTSMSIGRHIDRPNPPPSENTSTLVETIEETLMNPDAVRGAHILAGLKHIQDITNTVFNGVTRTTAIRKGDSPSKVSVGKKKRSKVLAAQQAALGFLSKALVPYPKNVYFEDQKMFLYKVHHSTLRQDHDCWLLEETKTPGPPASWTTLLGQLGLEAGFYPTLIVEDMFPQPSGPRIKATGSLTQPSLRYLAYTLIALSPQGGLRLDLIRHLIEVWAPGIYRKDQSLRKSLSNNVEFDSIEGKGQLGYWVLKPKQGKSREEKKNIGVGS